MSKDVKREVEEAVAQERKQAGEEKKPDSVPQEPVKDKHYFDQLHRDFDDNHMGDARRFSNKFGGRLVFDNLQGRWHRFNLTHWQEDIGRTYLHSLSEIAEDYRAQAGFYGRQIKELLASPEYQSANKTDQTAMLKPLLALKREWKQRAKDLKDPTRIEKVGKMAGVANPGFMGIKGEEWNPDPRLFACANVVIDLETGKALDPDPAMYINRASPVTWTSLHAESVQWEIFLSQIFNGDQELIDYVQKCVGYWLTGLMTHHEFYCLWGPQGRNGKGVFFRTIMSIMGTYFQTIPSKFLLDERTLQETDKPNQVLVDLQHTRLACASESPKKAKFSEGAIKQMSGADPITCRGMYSSHTTSYRAMFKMLFATNRIPSVAGDDKAFQDRLRIIKFPCTFKHGVEPNPKARVYPMDTQLEFKLHTPENLAGILAWAVRGAVTFLRTGDLTPPASVVSDTKEYMEQHDFIGEFIKDCLEITEAREDRAEVHEKTQMKDIYDVFVAWSKEEKSIPESKVWSQRALGQDFANRVELFKVPPRNKTFYNVRIKQEWLKSDEGSNLF